MILRLFLNAVFLVLLLAFVAQVAGTDVVDAVSRHVTGAINELSEIAKNVSNNKFAGAVAGILRNLAGGL